MPAEERQSPWESGERRPHFFKVLMGDFKKRLVSDSAVYFLLKCCLACMCANRPIYTSSSHIIHFDYIND